MNIYIHHILGKLTLLHETKIGIICVIYSTRFDFERAGYHCPTTYTSYTHTHFYLTLCKSSLWGPPLKTWLISFNTRILKIIIPDNY